ncbi:uncharacterized protein BX664DRAFT_385640 [Halteromyces radiatus]|uniref:uncharacterized protein n=1 Tax=Halteromyces radiatus TaxID=101107 RepID=UPI00221FF5CD|nr:uncharacterized protein BX664DRAFT_385640 [Halteromyces radiatus]KAI8089096.1 hypothetical protein BX664DRAFT_385640 [Halteromyces radiatus]
MDYVIKAIEAIQKEECIVARKIISSLPKKLKRDLPTKLSFEQQRTLLFFTIDRLPSSVDNKDNVCTTVASLFDQSLARYIYNHIHIVVPYALQLPIPSIHIDNNNNNSNKDTVPTVTTNIPENILMNAIASTLFTTTEKLYQDYGYLAIVYCLLLPVSTPTSQRLLLLEHTFNSLRAYIQRDHETRTENDNLSLDDLPKRLMESHVTRITALLSVELYQPNNEHVIDGLNKVKDWSGHHTKSLADYLEFYMLGILSHINQILSQPLPSSDQKNALLSLVVILDTIGPGASKFIPQVLSTAQMDQHTCYHSDGDGNAYYLLWNRLLSLSCMDGKSPLFSNVIRGMAHILPLCDHETKLKITNDLTHAIKSLFVQSDNTNNNPSILDDLPDLPDYQELEPLRQWIMEERNNNGNDNDESDTVPMVSSAVDYLEIQKKQDILKRLIVNMSMDEVVPSFDSLQQLYRILSRDQHIIYSPGNTNQIRPLLGELYQLLLRIIQQNSYRQDLCGLAAACLGLIGAIDPSRLLSATQRKELMIKIKTEECQNNNNDDDDGNNIRIQSQLYDRDMIVLENYSKLGENQAFVMHLILHYFLPTLQAPRSVGSSNQSTSSVSISASSSSTTHKMDEMIQKSSQYAIQQLLRAVAITPNTIQQKQNEANIVWSALDSTVKSFLSPLFYSNFSADIQFAERSLPLYEVANDSFDDWLRYFYGFLYRKVIITSTISTNIQQTSNTSSVNVETQMVRIFEACIPSVEAGHTILTQHLIPFLVLRVLLSADPVARDRQQVLEEILGVLKCDHFGPEMKQRSLKMVVSITNHCQTWIRQKMQEKKQKLKYTSSREDMEINTVRKFLNCIPNSLMAKAAFRTGNYPQALMHMELLYRENQDNLPAEDVDDLCQTYMHLEGPEIMSVVLSKFNPSFTRTQEILRFESRGEYQYAKLCYENILLESPQSSATLSTTQKNIHSQQQQEQQQQEDQLLFMDRYFNCLRHLGDYDRIINHAGSIVDQQGEQNCMMEQQSIMLQHVNAYRAEAAWKSSNWQLLHECVKQPMEDTFDASVARVLAHMQSNKQLAIYLDLQHAKMNQIAKICQNSFRAYSHSYDAVLRLQLLQDLETIVERRFENYNNNNKNNNNISCMIDDASDSDFLLWKTKFSLVKPSYHTQRQLLDIRIASEFGIWKNNHWQQPSLDIKKETPTIMTRTERELRLLLAKTARKQKDMTTALQIIYTIDPDIEPLALIEQAKWYYEKKDIKLAVQRLLDPRLQGNIKAKFLYARYSEIGHRRSSPDRQVLEYRKITKLYTEIRQESPTWEKAFYLSGAFEERRGGISTKDPLFFKRAKGAISLYADALKIGSRYYYSTMPRLLSLWLQIAESRRDIREQQQTKEVDENLYEAIHDAYTSANRCILMSVDKIPPYLFGLTLPRLVSRLAIEDREVALTLAKIILSVFLAYPRTTIWALQLALHSDDINMKTRSSSILQQAEKIQPNSLVTRVIHQTREFIRYLEMVAKEKNIQPTPHGNLSKYHGLLQMEDLDICIPQEMALLPSLPESISSSPLSSSTGMLYAHKHEPYPTDLPTIVRVLPTMQVMNSLQKPKRLSFKGSDGKTYDFLCKANDDLRKDARMMEFSHMINKFLTKNAISRQQRLYIRTYAVIPLGKKWGLIEWINNLNSFKAIVCDLWNVKGTDGARLLDRLRRSIKAHHDKSSGMSNNALVEEKTRFLVKEIYPHSPLVFYKWFLDNFPEPAQWFASRSRYVRTLAVMSIVGYVLGLGDRHAENLMFDATNGDTFHVDVNMLFDQGQELAVPETVPFRLTRNLIDAMGVTKEAGLFKKSCMITLDVLRENRTQLISVFETFLHDPIGDCRRKYIGLPHEKVAQSEIEAISTKIRSQLSVQAEVENLIREASSNKNLAQMYFGWSAFI